MKHTSPEGWSIDSASWAVNTLIRMYKRGEIDFDSKVQRDFIWTKKTSSKYIQSLLWGMLVYNMPHLYSKHGNVYFSIDGQQRALTLIKYVNNEFALVGLENYPVNIDGEIHKINGKRFKDLQPRLQEIILDFQINVAILEDAPESVEAEFFERANSGVYVSRKDVSFSKSNSKDEILELAKHEIFTPMFPNQKDKLTPRKEIIVKTYIAVNETVPDYSQKHYDKVMTETEFDEDDILKLKSVYDKILSAYKIVLIQDKDIADMVLKRTHLLSYISFVDKFENSAQLAKWFLDFYKDVPEEYHGATVKQTTNLRNIKVRSEIVGKSIEDFFERRG